MNRKSHPSFRLEPKSVILNDLEDGEDDDDELQCVIGESEGDCI